MIVLTGPLLILPNVKSSLFHDVLGLGATPPRSRDGRQVTIVMAADGSKPFHGAGKRRLSRTDFDGSNIFFTKMKVSYVRLCPCVYNI